MNPNDELAGSRRMDVTDHPGDVRSGEELDGKKLAAFLSGVLSQPVEDLTVRQFLGGYSNLTYLVRWQDREWVLRRPPFGAKVRSGHDMAREYRILTALERSYPKAPRAVAYSDDESILGAPFYLMKRVEGVILRSKMLPQTIPSPEVMAGVARSLVQTLTELHAVDFEAAGLAGLGRPGGYVSRQVRGWLERYEKAKTDDAPDMDRTSAWLNERQPAEAGAALIHNDFKYDNLVLDREDWTNVTAVLDWEMATLGDPMMDLGTSLGYWIDPADPPEFHALALSPTTLPGNPSRMGIAELYAEATGSSLENVVFYYVFGVFKIAVIVQQIYARYRKGHTQDSRFASLVEGVRACSRLAAQAIAKNRIDRLF